jgi:D-inositol-3-phosphate glycosyltransferase
MRIVVIGPTYPYRGGISHYTSALAHSLSEYHHDVVLVSFKRQYPRWLYPGRTDRDSMPGGISSSAQFLLDPLSPMTWCNTASYIAKTVPDIVVMQWWSTYWAPAFTGLGFLLRRQGIRLVYQVHNILPHEPRPGDVQLTRMALRWAQGFITWTIHDRERLRPHIEDVPVEICAMPIYSLPTNTTLSREAARAQLGIPNGVPVVLFFGYIRPYKGLRYLLSAVARLRECGVRVQLIIAGECWDHKTAYVRQIEQLGIADQVRLEDRYVPDEEVGAYFSAADMLAAPYLSDSQSAVVTMGLHFGIPLVVTQPLALRMPMRPDNMRVVPQGDAWSLAVAIASLWDEGAALHLSLPEFDGWEPLVRLIEGFSIRKV